MRKLFFSVAFAAGLALSVPPAMAGDPFSGFNMGVGVGYDDSSWEFKDGGNVDFAVNGMAADAFVGWGGRSGSTAFGGDIFVQNSWADETVEGLKLENGWSYGVNARLGWFANMNSILYAKGTLIRTKFKISGGGDSADKTKTGWGLGVGAETKVGGKTSARLEWTHIWYNDWNVEGLTIDPTSDVFLASLVWNL